MRIEVTAEDITAGIPFSCRLCPIAQALIRAYDVPFEMWHHVSVGDSYLYVPTQAGPKKFRTPKNVQGWMYDFDHNLGVQPFSFFIDFSLEMPL